MAKPIYPIKENLPMINRYLKFKFTVEAISKKLNIPSSAIRSHIEKKFGMTATEYAKSLRNKKS